ncbi:MAG: glycoside-pentoside-hexuronide (GPH):cation symporter [Gammaproteobacteria bacterium]|nr:glycoside-pentoside-hexuronide (GPH):cation symporter [Gammaproteobacteria bacterium]
MNISLGLRIGWGIGSLGSATLLNAISLLVLFYLVTILGMEPALAGLLVFLGKIYDMITDPLMGIVSDRTRSRFGRRRPWLLAGGLISALSMVMLFTPTSLDGGALIGYVVAALLLYATGYTMFNVPYLAMPAEMTTDPFERSRLMSFRVVFASVGILIGAAAAPVLIDWLGGGATGFARMSWIVGAIILFATVTCFATTGNARSTEQTETRESIREQLRTAAQNRPFMVLILSKLMQLIGVASTMSALLFLVTVILRRPESSLGIFGIASTLGTMAAMPVWLAASRRFGKRNTYALAITLYLPTVLSWLLSTPEESMTWFVLRGVVMGVATGGILLMAQSMLPDSIEQDFRLTGLRREGAFSAVYSFVEKTAFAFGPLVVGSLLSLMGFDREAGAEQTPGALLAIQLAAAVIPAIMGGVSALVLIGYRLDETGTDSAPAISAGEAKPGPA